MNKYLSIFCLLLLSLQAGFAADSGDLELHYSVNPSHTSNNIESGTIQLTVNNSSEEHINEETIQLNVNPDMNIELSEIPVYHLASGMEVTMVLTYQRNVNSSNDSVITAQLKADPSRQAILVSDNSKQIN